MTAALLVLVSILGMEVVSYATHRWVMHGFAMAWHRSHHAPPRGRFERNDLFPLCFSVLGVALFALALSVPSLWWVGVGVTAYGAAYLYVHEVYIHRRLPPPTRAGAYLEWLRRSHRAHHESGGEPYGMLLPLVGGSTAPSARDRDLLERSVRVVKTR